MVRFRGMADTTMIDRLMQFVESEMRSCSMCLLGAWRCCGFDGKVFNRCCGGRRL